MRTLLILIIAVALMPSATAVILNPTDDTFIGGGGMGVNWDEYADGMKVSSVAVGPPTYEPYAQAWMRFDVSGINAADVLDYELRVYVNSALNWTNVTWRFAFADVSSHGFGDDWNGADPGIGDETTLTGDNRPAGVAPVIAFNNYENILSLPGYATTKHASQALQDTFYNNVILSAINGDGICSVVVYASGLTQNAMLTDREGNPGNTFYPELILTIPEPASMTVIGGLVALLLRRKK